MKAEADRTFRASNGSAVSGERIDRSKLVKARTNRPLHPECGDVRQQDPLIRSFPNLPTMRRLFLAALLLSIGQHLLRLWRRFVVRCFRVTNAEGKEMRGYTYDGRTRHLQRVK